MQITETKVKVSDLCENYSDNGDGGVFELNGKLTIKPAFEVNSFTKTKIIEKAVGRYYEEYKKTGKV